LKSLGTGNDIVATEELAVLGGIGAAILSPVAFGAYLIARSDWDDHE
jgi:hypothetical protein